MANLARKRRMVGGDEMKMRFDNNLIRCLIVVWNISDMGRNEMEKKRNSFRLAWRKPASALHNFLIPLDFDGNNNNAIKMFCYKF